MVAYSVFENAKSQELKLGDSLSFSKNKKKQKKTRQDKKRGSRKEKEEDKYIRKQAST